MASVESLGSIIGMGRGAANTGVGDAIQKGMGLAQTAQQLELQRQQQEENKVKLDVQKFGAFKGMADTIVRAAGNKTLQKKLVEENKARLMKINPAADPGIFDIIAADKTSARNYAIISDYINDKTHDPEIARQGLQAIQSAELFSDKQTDLVQTIMNKSKLETQLSQSEAKNDALVKAANIRAGAQAGRQDALEAQRGKGNLFRASLAYDRNMKQSENGLHQARRAVHLIEKVDSGQLQANKALRADLSASLGSLVNGGRPATVYSMSEQEFSSAFQRVMDAYNWAAGTAQTTLPKAQLDQLLLDVKALQQEYGMQHADTYTSLRESMPEEVVPKLDARFNKIRKNGGLPTLDEIDGGESAAGHGEAAPKVPPGRTVAPPPAPKGKSLADRQAEFRAKAATLVNPKTQQKYTAEEIEALVPKR